MRQILPFINLNGKITGQKSAGISILNEGFLYGKGIFTTIKVRAGIPLFLGRHLLRLQNSATQLNLLSPITYHLSPIKRAIHATIVKNKLINGGIRITLAPATICIHAFCFNCHSERPEGAEESHTTVSVITLPDPRDIYKTIKTTYRLPHILAQEQARSQGAGDALFTQNNELIESTTANIISCVNKNALITAPISNNGLNGITRQILMENLPIRETPIPITTTNPLIVVNSLSLRIVKSIDGRKINQNPEFANLIRQTLDEAEKNYIENHL